MPESALVLSDTVNLHYLDKVMDMADERTISATEDIFDSHGMKLIAKGTRISRALEEKLIVHKLRKPLEHCIALEGSMDMRAVIAEAKRLAQTYESVGYIVRSATQARNDPLAVLNSVQFGSAMSLMLSITERGGQDAFTHSVLVGLLAACLAGKAGLGTTDQSIAALGGLLHDIGELYIEPKYLRPDKRLLPHEWRHVIVHPHIGRLLIEQLESAPPAVARAVAEHHERFDGAGYPGQLTGRHISVVGQVLSVADLIADLLREHDVPLERAELALKIIPNEHPYELVSAISTTLHNAPAADPAKDAQLPADEANERAKILFDHIAVVVETGDKMSELDRLQTVKAKELLHQTVKRLDTVQRAFYSTGLDACEREDTAQSREILFEAIIATEEIQWRLREIARDLALRSAALETEEAEAFRPLIAMLDAEPDARSLVRRTSSRSAAMHLSKPEAAPERQEVPQRTLLLVDDEPNVLNALNRLLRPYKYKIFTANNAAEALEILANNEIGVILSDHRMPGMTGVELLSRVKTMYPLTVRMVLSGYADVNTVTDAIRLGAVYKFLTKPWNPDDLCKILQSAFERHEEICS